jgi:hypothetical protein
MSDDIGNGTAAHTIALADRRVFKSPKPPSSHRRLDLDRADGIPRQHPGSRLRLRRE